MTDFHNALSDWSDADLVDRLSDDLIDGLPDDVARVVQVLIARGWTPYKVFSSALITAMKSVADEFRDGDLMIPDLLAAYRNFVAATAGLRLPGTGTGATGTVIVPWSRLDDVAPDVARLLVEGAGFALIELDTAVSGDRRAGGREQRIPDFGGITTLFTVTLPYLRTAIDAIKERGTSGPCIVLLPGRAPQSPAEASLRLTVRL